jgi:hypothetical protein
MNLLTTLINPDRLTHGSHMSERGRGTHRLFGPFLNGKEAFILSTLYSDEGFINPYLHGSDLYYAWRSGVAIERADQRDAVMGYQS